MGSQKTIKGRYIFVLATGVVGRVVNMTFLSVKGMTLGHTLQLLFYTILIRKMASVLKPI